MSPKVGVIVNPSSQVKILLTEGSFANSQDITTSKNLAAAARDIHKPSFNLAQGITSAGNRVINHVGNFIGTQNAVAQNPEFAWMKNAGAIPV